MILKVLDYKESKNHSGCYEEWTYFDNIESASISCDDEIDKLPAVCCRFPGDIVITFHIPNVAYLLSDNGKMLDKIVAGNVEEIGDTEPIYNTLTEAVAAAKKEQM